MRGNVLELVRVIASLVDLPEPIVEIGSFQVPNQPYASDLRPFFPGKQFIGCDARPGTGVDRVEDVHALSFADGSVGTILMLETLEHVADPIRALQQARRVLRPEGFCVITSCMDTPVHDHPSDYWRFTPQGFDLLVKDLSPRRTFSQGHPLFPHTVASIARKGGSEAPLELLDEAIPRIPGTLTQEISPRLAPDPFRPLGATLSDEEQAKYPELMLHVAYHRIHELRDEVDRLREELAERDAAGSGVKGALRTLLRR
jgi:SAM-dependent methyltransferase